MKGVLFASSHWFKICALEWVLVAIGKRSWGGLLQEKYPWVAETKGVLAGIMPVFLLSMAPSMIQEIQHVSGRCGGGKSRETIKALTKYLAGTQPAAETYLFASKTLELSDQNYQLMLGEAAAFSNAVIPVKKIDSSTCASSVLLALIEIMEEGFRGVLFITHKTLALLPEEQLRGTYVLIDEVPQVLAGSLMVRYDLKDKGHSWEKYLDVTASSCGSGDVVQLAPHVDKGEVSRRISDIRCGRDTTTAPKVADLLECLLLGKEPIYASRKSSMNGVEQVYQCVHYHRLTKLVSSVEFLAVLSPQLSSTLFGFIAEKLLGIPIVEKDPNPSMKIEKKHGHKVAIIPVLSSGHWSSTLLSSQAGETLIRNGVAVRSSMTVAEFAQTFAKSHIGSRPFLLTLNRKIKTLEALEQQGVIRTNTGVHGLSSYEHVHVGVYLAATNLTPFDARVFRKFAARNGLNADDLLYAIKVERSYAAAYQCIGRTSIRQPANGTNRHLIIVPDLKCANYLRNNWFDPAKVDILAHHSYQTKRAYELARAKRHRFNKIVSILQSYHDKNGKLKYLVPAAGISMTSFRKYLKEFEQPLTTKRLLPLKPKRGPAKERLYVKRSAVTQVL
ncbi:hypothetical protein [Vreelandella piezotolerans]|nr:hypothetical protein [Halomonas piezotolerans]